MKECNKIQIFGKVSEIKDYGRYKVFSMNSDNQNLPCIVYNQDLVLDKIKKDDLITVIGKLKTYQKDNALKFNIVVTDVLRNTETKVNFQARQRIFSI
jgi:RPA family protein